MQSIYNKPELNNLETSQRWKWTMQQLREDLIMRMKHNELSYHVANVASIECRFRS